MAGSYPRPLPRASRTATISAMQSASFTREELLSNHAFARPHEAAGRRLHGGLDAQGRYLPPRTQVREPAVRAWEQRLVERGGELLRADLSLLPAPLFPNFEQQKCLLAHGLGQTLWNTLTITGVIEARGKILAEFPAPEFADVVEDDLSETATGHLRRGLLEAHGFDEGGAPDSDLGAHDAMWFAARDLALGIDSYPMPEIPESIGRPDAGRLCPSLPIGHEMMLSLLANVLLIEIRAEKVFSFVQALLRQHQLFKARTSDLELAHEMIARIRTDEAIHVDYLRLVLSELRTFTFRGLDGSRLPGAAVLDPLWNAVVQWHALENPRLARAQMEPVLRARILTHPDGAAILEEIESLADA